jgi:RNA polymerase sigma-70 factor (ECF subfamily)
VSVTQPDLPAHQPSEWAEAFTKICDRHRGRLIRWLTAIFGARDAEDIAQEALARLYVRPELLDPDADAWPWLSVVARNVGRDLLRHNAQSTTVEHDVLDGMPGCDAVRDSVCDQVVAREDAVRLSTALRSLSPRERQVIRLRDFDGVSISVIADLTDSNENAVRQLLFRARRRLGSVYLELGGERRLGLSALLGLKVREAYRRHTAALDVLTGSSATMFAAVLPALAIVVGGTAGLLLPPAFGGGSTRTAAYALGDDALRHGLAGRDGRPLYAVPSGERVPAHHAAPPATRPGIRARPSIGPVSADLSVSPNPFSKDGGRDFEDHVKIVLPNGTEVRLDGYQDKHPGYGLVCRLPMVDCG